MWLTSMKFYGRFYRFSRFLVRRFYPSYRFENDQWLQDPAVYLCRHFNSQGIFMTVPWLPGRFHIWSLHLYHRAKTCYRHMMDFTLTKRLAWPKWKAWLASVLIGLLFPPLVRSSRSIAVYRNSMKVMKTYQQSRDALIKGESLLIFPDKDYLSKKSDIGEMYHGFLMIDSLYYRSTGKHIPFIPLYADQTTRTVCVGEPVIVQGSIREPAECQRVYKAIRDHLSGLSHQQTDLKTDGPSC